MIKLGAIFDAFHRGRSGSNFEMGLISQLFACRFVATSRYNISLGLPHSQRFLKKYRLLHITVVTIVTDLGFHQPKATNSQPSPERV